MKRTIRSEILEWYCNDSKLGKSCIGRLKNQCGLLPPDNCNKYKQLSALITKLVEGAPCREIKDPNIVTIAYNKHCQEISKWKKKVLKP